MSFKIALFLLFATSAIAGKTGPDFVLPNGKDMHYNNPLLHLTHEQHMDIFGTSLFTLSNQDSNCMDLAFSHLYSDICSGTSFIHNSTAESLNIKAPSEIDHVGAKCLYDGCKDRVAKGLVTPSCDIVLAGPNSCSWNTSVYGNYDRLSDARSGVRTVYHGGASAGDDSDEEEEKFPRAFDNNFYSFHKSLVTFNTAETVATPVAANNTDTESVLSIATTSDNGTVISLISSTSTNSTTTVNSNKSSSSVVFVMEYQELINMDDIPDFSDFSSDESDNHSEAASFASSASTNSFMTDFSSLSSHDDPDSDFILSSSCSADS